MKRLVALGLMALVACGQQPTAVTETKDSEPNTWVPIPYDPNSGVVTVNSPEELFGLFKTKVDDKPVKGEYETTEQFEVRVNDIPAILAPIDVGVTYLVPTRTSNFVYNADAQVFTLDEGSSTVKCLYDYKLKANVCWIATKVYGHGRGGEDYKLAINLQQEELVPQFDILHALPHRCPVPFDQAPGLKEHLRMAYGVQFDRAVVHYGENRVFNADPSNHAGNKYFTSVIMPVRLTHMVCFDERDNSVVYQEEF